MKFVQMRVIRFWEKRCVSCLQTLERKAARYAALNNRELPRNSGVFWRYNHKIRAPIPLPIRRRDFHFRNAGSVCCGQCSCSQCPARGPCFASADKSWQRARIDSPCRRTSIRHRVLSSESRRLESAPGSASSAASAFVYKVAPSNSGSL